MLRESFQLRKRRKLLINLIETISKFSEPHIIITITKMYINTVLTIKEYSIKKILKSGKELTS